MSRGLGRITAILLVFFTASATAGEPGLWFRKELDRGEAIGEAILGVPLDSDIFAATRDGYPDLRIVDDRGIETPYALEQISRKHLGKTREPCASKVVSLKVDEGKALEVVVALDEKAPEATGMTIRTPLADYEHKVRVDGSTSGRDWSPRVDDGLIFDYSRFMDIRNRDITFPPGGDRMFKVIIERELDDRESPFRQMIKGREEGKKDQRVEVTGIERRPFRIDGIDMWRTVEYESGSEPEPFTHPAAGFSVEHDPKAKVTRIEVQALREPITALTLKTASRNFSRPVRVELPSAQGGRGEWVEIGRGTAFLFRFHAFHRESLRVGFPETRQDRFRIVIENADNPPLDITGVDAEGTGYRLVFLAPEGRRYRVEYGSDTIPTPSYDTAAVLASLRHGYQPVNTRLDPQVANPGVRPGRGLREILNSPTFFTLAILVMVLVLAWSLFRAGRQLKGPPEREV